MAEGAKKPKVLIVDDTPENIQVLMGTLKDQYAIVAAINGEKALKMAIAEPRPDLILLDIMMPGMDGFEVCRRLKADPGNPGNTGHFSFRARRYGEQGERVHGRGRGLYLEAFPAGRGPCQGQYPSHHEPSETEPC